MMVSRELLDIDPMELKIPFELKKQISCSLQLSNKTYDYIAYKMKTTNPKKYSVKPHTGILPPRSSCEVIVIMQAKKRTPRNMQCKDKFLVLSAVVNEGIAVKGITSEMFERDSGNTVDEVMLRVLYVPPTPSSPVPEGSGEGSSHRPSVSDNGSASSSELLAATKVFADDLQQEKSSENLALVSKLSEENNDVIQLNTKLQQELELMRREANQQQGGFSLTFVVIIASLGILLGYLFRT